MSAPTFSKRKKSSAPARQAAGKTFRDGKYIPQFALGIYCADEQEQRRLYDTLRAAIPAKEIKVLVI